MQSTISQIKILLDKMGYNVSNEYGNKNIKANIFDLMLSFLYAGLSFANIIPGLLVEQSIPSKIVFSINVIVVSRLIVKNYVRFKDETSKYNSSENRVYFVKLFYLKIIPMIVCVVMYLILFILTYIYENGVTLVLVTIGIIGVIIITLLENIFTILENLFEATPQIYIRVNP